MFICIFSPSLVQDFYDATKNCVINKPIVEMKEYEANALDEKEENPFKRIAALYSVCSKVYQNGCDMLCETKNYELLSKISAYIQDIFNKRISMKAMCRDMGYSYHYISGAFRKGFGVYFSTYVNQIRLDKAEELLCNTQLSSAEIAYECGFNTIRNFNIAFKNHYSITLKEFRKSEDKRTIIIND